MPVLFRISRSGSTSVLKANVSNGMFAEMVSRLCWENTVSQFAHETI